MQTDGCCAVLPAALPRQAAAANCGVSAELVHACSPVSRSAASASALSAALQDQGNRTTPSYVAFSDTERLIGEAAKNQAAAVRDRNPHTQTWSRGQDRRGEASVTPFPLAIAWLTCPSLAVGLGTRVPVSRIPPTQCSTRSA